MILTMRRCEVRKTMSSRALLSGFRMSADCVPSGWHLGRVVGRKHWFDLLFLSASMHSCTSFDEKRTIFDQFRFFRVS